MGMIVDNNMCKFVDAYLRRRDVYNARPIAMKIADEVTRKKMLCLIAVKALKKKRLYWYVIKECIELGGYEITPANLERCAKKLLAEGLVRGFFESLELLKRLPTEQEIAALKRRFVEGRDHKTLVFLAKRLTDDRQKTSLLESALEIALRRGYYEECKEYAELLGRKLTTVELEALRLGYIKCGGLGTGVMIAIDLERPLTTSDIWAHCLRGGSEYGGIKYIDLEQIVKLVGPGEELNKLLEMEIAYRIQEGCGLEATLDVAKLRGRFLSVCELRAVLANSIRSWSEFLDVLSQTYGCENIAELGTAVLVRQEKGDHPSEDESAAILAIAKKLPPGTTRDQILKFLAKSYISNNDHNGVMETLGMIDEELGEGFFDELLDYR